MTLDLVGRLNGPKQSPNESPRMGPEPKWAASPASHRSQPSQPAGADSAASPASIKIPIQNLHKRTFKTEPSQQNLHNRTFTTEPSQQNLHRTFTKKLQKTTFPKTFTKKKEFKIPTILQPCSGFDPQWIRGKNEKTKQEFFSAGCFLPRRRRGAERAGGAALPQLLCYTLKPIAVHGRLGHFGFCGRPPTSRPASAVVTRIVDACLEIFPRGKCSAAATVAAALPRRRSPPAPARRWPDLLDGRGSTLTADRGGALLGFVRASF